MWLWQTLKWPSESRFAQRVYRSVGSLTWSCSFGTNVKTVFPESPRAGVRRCVHRPPATCPTARPAATTPGASAASAAPRPAPTPAPSVARRRRAFPTLYPSAVSRQTTCDADYTSSNSALALGDFLHDGDGVLAMPNDDSALQVATTLAGAASAGHPVCCLVNGGFRCQYFSLTPLSVCAAAAATTACSA